MVDKLDMRVQIVELLVGSREAAKCAEHMNDYAQEDEAHKEDVHPGVVCTVSRRRRRRWRSGWRRGPCRNSRSQ